MTRSDKWKNRPCVIKYFAYKDKVKKLDIKIQNGDHIVFYLPMPVSWSKKKKSEHNNKPHTQTPDLDNLLKALLDAIFENDSHIHKLAGLEKKWSYTGEIEIH